MTSANPPDLPQRMMLAARLAGVATQRLRAGDLPGAAHVLEVARGLHAEGFRMRMAFARLAILEGHVDSAIEDLAIARELDPFDEEAADLLAQLHSQREEHLLALENRIDAKLLMGAVDPERMKQYEDEISRLLAELEITDPEEADEFITGREERLQGLAQRYEREAEEKNEAEAGGEPASLELLRAIPFFARLTDREMGLLQSAVVRRRVQAGKAVFREGQPSEDVYVVESGRVVIQRETPFGPQDLASVGPGAIFGEMNFIDGLSRSADAIAQEDTSILRLSHEALRALFTAERHVAITFLQEFWRALSDKVREGNELMRSFFPEGGPPKPAGGEAASEGKTSGVDAAAKAGVLHEKGLTGHDLEVLASHAKAVDYDVEQAIFREGEPGEDLCIVLEGKVRIEKAIPGVGQEALAILDRGDFFGEMAVIDRAPRSATVIAHAPGTTILRIRRADIDELLGSGAEAAHEFLLILCRILSSRLRENNDKIVQWRMMSGGF